MNDRTDQQLLRDYAERQSEAAFAAIAHRYVDLIYSAALRMIHDSHLAQDVTQGVFVALAKHAHQLADRPVLAGWLHGTAQNIAAQTVRTDVRRRAREQEAALMHELLPANPDANWEHIAPHLDAALGELSEPDRDAVLLRYFKNQDLRTVGASLGISDDAAQKRVSRAVERLREFFAKRGVTVGASGFAVVISANSVQAAPVGLALTISAAALTGTTIATTATATATKAVAMTILQKTAATATIALLAGAGIYEARQAARMRDQVQTLRRHQAPMEQQIQKLQTERGESVRQIAALREDNERLNRNTTELLKLRGQVGLLRKESEEWKRLREANPQFAHTSEATASNRTNSAKSQTVSKIIVTRIKQPQTLSEELIRTYISMTAGDTLDRTKVDRDVQNLYSAGVFFNVRVAESSTDAGITLNYLVQEKPRLAAINIVGNTKFREPDLTTLLTSKVGKALDERTLFSDAEKIQQGYSRSGFGETKVKYSTRINEDLGEGEVTFAIAE